MELLAFQKPNRPMFTVQSLAKTMTLPVWEQAKELRDQKFPRAGSGKQRVPYYQPAMLAIAGFIKSGMDIRVFAKSMEDLEARLAEAERDENASKQAIARLNHNIRLLDAVPGFARFQDITGIMATQTKKILISDAEIRYTPNFVIQIKDARRYVFVHTRDEELDEEEARRTLELAHWVDRDSGNVDAIFNDLEYWVLSENRVLNWKTPRKKTVLQVKQSLPIFIGAWDAMEAEPSKQRPTSKQATG